MVTSNEKSHLLQGQSLYWSNGSLSRYLMMALFSSASLSYSLSHYHNIIINILINILIITITEAT